MPNLSTDAALAAVQAEGIGELHRREHHHLERDDHGEDEQVVDQGRPPRLHARDEVRQHRRQEHDDEHRSDGDDERPEDGLEEVLRLDPGDVVAEPGPHVPQRHREGVRRDGELLLEGVEDDEDDRPQKQAHEGHQQRVDEDLAHRVAALAAGLGRRGRRRSSDRYGGNCLRLRAHASTSLLRVARSCSSAIATTTMTNRTALAWPTPCRPICENIVLKMSSATILVWSMGAPSVSARF